MIQEHPVRLSQSPPDHRPSPREGREHGRWVITAAVLFLIELIVRGRHGAFGSRGPTIYWAFHWASDYSRGFVRRGFLGELLRLAHLDNTSYALISILSLCISIALYAVFVRSLFRLVGRLTGIERTLVAIVLALSPMTAGMMIETSGDPIQLLMLCFLLLFTVIVVPGRGVLVSGVSFAVFGALSALTHEASVFFILPALAVAAFVLQRTASARAAFFGNLAGALVFTTLIVFNTQKVPDGSVPAFLPTLHYHAMTSTMPPDTFPKFSQLLAIEDRDNFGHGVKGDVQTGIRLAGALTLPFLLICLLTALFFGRDRGTAATRRRVFAAFALSVLLSVPLYIIGHDWGRFVSYSFLLTFCILTFWRPEPVVEPIAHLDGDRRIPLSLGLLIAGFTLVPSPIGFILTGVLYSHINFAGEMLLIALVVAQTRHYWAANLSLREGQRLTIAEKV